LDPREGARPRVASVQSIEEVMRMMVEVRRITAAFALVALAAVPARAQVATPTGNQATADAVATALRSSAGLAAARIEIETRSGQVTLRGALARADQKAEAIARTRQVPGVVGVIDNLRVVGDSRVRTAQYEVQPQPTQVALGLHHRRSGGDSIVGDDGSMIGPDGNGLAADSMAAGAVGADGGPLPEGPAGPATATGAVAGYPNYAWPSYAPYPNFSAVGYPLVYPWQAWPNIGPFYPYPEVPADWRAVTAAYHDGLWHVKFRHNYTRPFFMVWPFGGVLFGGY
jgi:hypothetical protein